MSQPIPQLIPITRPDLMQAAGLPFQSTDSARWAERTASEKGFAASFIRIGRRVYINPARFHELVREAQ
ncbi:MAG: hypothetical protein QM808_16305 [Steroidobacteraceae bacterium]